jgi:3-deoxy-7-phosphoheptulonate synthase
MIIVMKRGATAGDISFVVNQVETSGYRAHLSQGTERTIIGVVGDDRPLENHNFELLSGVEQVVRILQPFKLASRDFHPENTIVDVRGVLVGGQKLAIVAGPCSVEGRSQLLETAWAVKEAGATILRAGAFKPRSSPYSFQGMGEEGLELLAEAREATGMPIITEVMSTEQVPLVSKYTDVLQIGARNMQNFPLLQAVGRTRIPVMLKRGLMNTAQEWLLSADYVLSGGNRQVMLCERGIRTFETATRNTFDINAIPLLKGWTHLPVLGDPSHGTGKWDLVAAVGRACIAAGADGLMVEVHPDPAKALSDGAQSLKPERFAELVASIRKIAPAVERTV